MGEIKILAIRHHPRWKFWRITQWDVTVNINGKIREVHIYDTPPLIPCDFLRYVQRKVLYGDQWTRSSTQELKRREKDMEPELQKLIGEVIPLPP